MWLRLTELGVAKAEAGDEMFLGQACRHQLQMHTGGEPCRADTLAVQAFVVSAGTTSANKALCNHNGNGQLSQQTAHEKEEHHYPIFTSKDY